MNDKRYFWNIHEIEDIISKLDEGIINPEDADDLFIRGKELLEECELILASYMGTIEVLDAS